MVRINDELLRDWRTGLLPAPVAILRALLEPHPGIRGPYELEGAISALARLGLHLLARVEELEKALASQPRAADQRPDEGRKGAATQPKDVRAWKRRAVDVDAEPVEEPEPPAADPTPDTARLPNVIHHLLDTSPGQWWTPAEICTALLKSKAWVGPLTNLQVSGVCTMRWQARGWQRRVHPAWPNRRQYSAPVPAAVGSKA